MAQDIREPDEPTERRPDSGEGDSLHVEQGIHLDSLSTMKTPMRTTMGSLALGLALGLLPCAAAGQVEVSTGVFVEPKPSVGSTRAGPLLAVAFSTGALGIPLFVEADIARTDFTSLGQDYHHNHTLLTLGTEWFPFQGPTRMGVRLGLGASREVEIVEANPPSPGGDNWIETIVPGLVVERRVGGGRSLVLGVSDYVLGPFGAVLDPQEYGVAHLITVTVGVRFGAREGEVGPRR